MMIGVDYQPGGQAGYKPQEKRDPLTDKDICLRDAIMLQRLGANTIRVYNVDPTLNHDECASIFNAAGIYMVVDVNGPFSGESINRAEPWTSYHEGYLKRIFGVVENFKEYPNTLAFFSANEVMNDLKTGKVNPQYIRVSFALVLVLSLGCDIDIYRPSNAISKPISKTTPAAPFP
jgi:1,3-beta-glucanosyltransferase GAS3